MTAGSRFEPSTPGSEFVDNILAYYSSEGATKATPTAPSLSCMRPKSYESSAQSTDSEHTGARSSESASSSLGDSAQAAARVLAAWQDRAGGSPGSGAAVSMGDGSALWSTVQQQQQQSRTKVHSSTSTPRLSRGAFGAQTREGSAPVAGSIEAGQRGADMSFLALLNSAAAYVAESSNGSTPAQQQQEHQHQPQPQEQQQQQHMDTYTGRSELLSNASLALSNINADFDQSRVSGEEAGFHPHYGASFQENQVFQDFAQVLRHMTTGDSESGLAAAASTGDADHPPFSAPSFDNNGSSIAAAVRPDQVMGYSLASGSNPAPTVSTPLPKRKRKDGSQTQQSPARRKTSQVSDRGKAATPSELRRAARKWSEEETENLLQGCSKYGVGAWKKILDDPNFTFNNRTSVDLKDRFRTIRAQECAHSPYAKTGKGSTKEPDVVWPLPPNSQRLQGLQRVQRKPTRNYTNDEDRRLLIGVLRHANHWTKIAADPDLKLGDRPGQSLRDRLRNAFPEVFELFGYVIPKKERADRERSCPTPTHACEKPASASKRKAPTGSKRLEGEIPEHIRERITGLLHAMGASLDPRPIPEFSMENGHDNSGSASPHNASCAPMDVGSRNSSSGLASMDTGSQNSSSGLASSMDVGVKTEASSTPQSSRRQSHGSRNASEQTHGRGRGRRRASTRRTRSSSKAASAAYSSQQQQQHIDAPLAAGAGNGGIHSAPVHASVGAGFGQLGDMGAFSEAEHRRSGPASASALAAQHRSLLFDSFSPSVFSRPLGTMTPTDQLDALALEGRVASGYSTPTQAASSKRRHSVQADINDALAAAALAAGIDRSSFASALQFFPGMGGLDHTNAANSGVPINAADSIRRMTVAGPIGADPFIFPRLPDEGADVVGHVGQPREARDSGAHSAGVLTATSEAAITPHAVNTSDAFKFSATSAMEASALSATSAMDGRDDSYAAHRGQLRSAGRLLRANGVADDNSIGLSTTSTGDSRVDLEALTQFSQWFPSLASGWNIGASSQSTSENAGTGQMCGESIDPNMLDAGLGSAATMVASSAAGEAGGLDMHEAGMTHARRRSQFDWYGLTPSLAAALDAASTTAAAAAHAASVSDASIAPLAPFSIGQGAYRRPSMPIFPSFAFAQNGEVLNMPVHADDMHGSMTTTAEPISYGADTQDGSNIAAAAAAAAAAVAVALSDGSESLSIQAADPAAPGHIGMRSYSMGAGSAMASNALAKLAGMNSNPHLTTSARPRVADTQHRRRTMHVPPSLVEGVASGFETGEGAASVVNNTRAQRTRVFPYPPRPTNTPQQAEALGTRARRSRSISSNQNTRLQQHAAIAQQLPAVSEAPSSGLLQTQFPALPTAAESSEQNLQHGEAGASGGLRHARTYSGTQFSQDALSALAGVSPGLLSGVGMGESHFDLTTGLSTTDNMVGNSSNSSNMDIDLEAMTSLSTSGMELSFKPSLWAEDASQLHDETRSLADVRAELASNMVDLYRPASSTPTGGHHRYLGIIGTGSARNASPNMVAQSAAAVSPVAPRSAASTPGRREAVGI